jgi:hypothetical protein
MHLPDEKEDEAAEEEKAAAEDAEGRCLLQKQQLHRRERLLQRRLRQ